MNTAVLTALAIVAFAANALLARWTLGDELLDPASFASLRAVSAAVVLAFLVKRTAPDSAAGPRPPRDFMAASALAVFLLLVSYSYVTVEAGLGSLLMVAGAHLTGSSLRSPRRGVYGPRRLADLADPRFIGSLLVLAAVAYLVAPEDDASWDVGELAMIAAGLAAGVYFRRVGRTDGMLAATSRNMTLAVIPVLAIHVIVAGTALVTLPGVLIAVCAGALTTAGGFALWYSALPTLKATPTAVARVAVPLIVIPCGIVLLGERPDTGLAIVWLVLLAGAVIAARGRPAGAKDS